jgi:hypothetical protein
MAISKSFQSAIKGRKIQEFVKENGRAPTLDEQREILKKEYEKFSSIDEVGFAGFLIEKPQFRTESSASDEMQNRDALFDDAKVLADRVTQLAEVLEDSFRGFQASGRRTSKLLSQMESRVDNLLLLNKDIDVFVHGVEETFDTQDFINHAETSAAIESNYVTCGRSGYSPLPLENLVMNATTTSDKGTIGTDTSSSLQLLKEDDGSFWEHIVYTKYKQGRVSLVMDLDFGEPTYIGDFRMTLNPVSANKRTTATIFYSINGQTYTAYEPSEFVVSDGELSVNIGVADVKKMQIVFSKEAADNETATQNQYAYVFSIDSLKIFSDKYKKHETSVLFAGPYDVIDEEGLPVNFTKAKLTACTIEPEDTSVSFSLSKNGQDYYPVSHRDESVDIVSFNSGDIEGTYGLVDESFGVGSLQESVAGLEDVNFRSEAIINGYLLEDFVDKVPLRSIKIKRGVVAAGLPDEILQAPPGWFYDRSTEEYSCTVYVSAIEGRDIDFGPRGVTVNDNLLSGVVHLTQGYSVIRTSDSNWQEITANITSLDELIDADPLYPYNHRYLIEPYSYGPGFAGEKIYLGVAEYFGRLLKYVAPEKFSSFIDDGDYSVFTIERSDGNAYFKVKVDKADASWFSETYELDWLAHADDTNQIYVRAQLVTSNEEKTPTIEHFKVRVI